MIGIAATLLLFLVLAAPAWAQPAGAAVFSRCKVCHSLAAGAHSPVGPNLHTLFGRAAGSEPGFSFSPAMQKSGVAWNDDTLAKFLRDPQGFIPGNRMGFPGIKDDQELAALVAYLKQATQ